LDDLLGGGLEEGTKHAGAAGARQYRVVGPVRGCSRTARAASAMFLFEEATSNLLNRARTV
jgi:hypothetical protein